MKELEDDSIDLIITSPPYGQIKDYNIESQIGYGEEFSDYYLRLKHVWKECKRVLNPQRRICINIGDQYLRARDYDRYRVLPIASKIIQDCIEIGFDFMGDIIWKKVSTTNTTGGCSLMGSLFYPGNGMVTYDYEHILIFKKIEGTLKKVNRETKELSKICMDEWKRWYVGHWVFPGVQQKEHIAMFPEELPYRLIRMFSYPNETILDPFAGSGTTLKVARNYGRKAIGYEINADFAPIIQNKVRESYYQRDYYFIIRKLYQKHFSFDFRFSTQKSIVCIIEKDEKVVIDFLKLPEECLKTDLERIIDNKIQENNVQHYLLGKKTWIDISRYLIIVDNPTKLELNSSIEKNGKKVLFIDYDEYMK
jgi:DNA modification methylase